MLHHTDQQAATVIYKSPKSMHSCVLCGKDTLTVRFKGKCVCEDCLNFARDLY
jgi:hypothetical protein